MTRTKLAAVLLAVVGLASPALAADEPGVFKVPGTDSTIKFYGYVQLDATVDFSGRPTDIEDFDWATILPMVPGDKTGDAKKKPQTYLTARTSRFGIITNTPSGMGNIGVRLEGDFNGPNGFQSENYTNSVLFRLRHAYGTIGGLLIGQTWSTFLDLGAAPDTVDFNGPGDLALVRNPMIRYTAGLGEGMNLALAIENTRGQQYGPDSRFQQIPDLHANFTYAGKWGHLSIRGVGQNFVRQVGTAGNESNKSKFAVSGAVSGSAKFGGDVLVAQVAGGQSIGRYLLNAVGNEFAAGKTHGFVTVDANNEIKTWTAFGYHVGFTHVWSPEYRSNIVWSQTFIQDPKINGVAADNTAQKDMMQLFVNTFWSMSKTTEVGVEYAYGQWKSFDGGGTLTETKGTENRVTATFHYNFF
jgi:DcaP outer membrane protein